MTYSHSALRLGSWWFHESLQSENGKKLCVPADVDAIKGLRIAVTCGVLFMVLQIREYY